MVETLSVKKKIKFNFASTKFWAGMIGMIAIIVWESIEVYNGVGAEVHAVFVGGLISIIAFYFGFRTKQDIEIAKLNGNGGLR